MGRLECEFGRRRARDTECCQGGMKPTARGRVQQQLSRPPPARPRRFNWQGPRAPIKGGIRTRLWCAPGAYPLPSLTTPLLPLLLRETIPTDDDAASYYFAITLLVAILLPLTASLSRQVTRVLFPPSRNSASKARTQEEREKLVKLEASERDLSQLRKPWFMTMAGVALLGWLAVAVLVSSVGEEAQIAQFDPFDILGVEEGSTDAQIKRAYRKLSLKFHPDRWVNAPADEQSLASTKFMKIAKAYEALTDPVAKKNYELYGNPDGRQAFSVSLGLPQWLLERSNQAPVLAAYIMVIALVMPGLAMLYYRNSSKYADRPILKRTLELLAFVIRPKPNIKHLPEFLALAEEFREFRVRSQAEAELLDSMRLSMVEQDRMPKKMSPFSEQHSFSKAQYVTKANILIHAHLNRLHDRLTPELRSDLNYILSKAPLIVDSMLEIAKSSLHLPTVQVIIQFEQHLTQAMYFGDSPLLQLPHFTQEDAKHFQGGSKKKGGLGGVMDPVSAKSDSGNSVIERFMEAAPQKHLNNRKKGMATFTDEQVRDVDEIVPLLPTHIDMVFRAGTAAEVSADGDTVVEWEPHTVFGDFITFRYLIVPPGKTASLDDTPRDKEPTAEAPPSPTAQATKRRRRRGNAEGKILAYAPRFPLNKTEKWYVIVCGGPAIPPQPRGPRGPEKIVGFENVRDFDLHPCTALGLLVLASPRPDDNT